MVTWRGKSDPLRLLGRRLLSVALVIAVFSVAWAVWNIFWKNREAGRLRAEAEAQLADLSERHQKLEAHYEKLKTERGMEEALREQYAVGSEGEGLIVIVEPKKAEPIHATSSIMQWIKDVFTRW